VAPSPLEREWLEHVVASRAQTLEDVAVAHMATVAILTGDRIDAAFEALGDHALGAGFAVASCSLATTPLNELHDVVGALAGSLRIPSYDRGRKHGLVSALDAFIERHSKRAEERFEEAAEKEALGGELRVLAREYIAQATGRSSARRIHRWLGGEEVTQSADAVRVLQPRTSKQAFAHLSRLTRALGFRGLRVLMRDAHALVDLPPARRDVAYTVIRELIDNSDGGHGLVAVEILLLGSYALETRVHTLTEHPALNTRIALPLAMDIPIPHQTWVRVDPNEIESLPPVPTASVVAATRADSLRALVRVAQGLPPLEANPELTVGMEQVDSRIEQLFATSAHDGSVFAVLVGEYGAGKTHHLLHLEARALDDQRPVLRLAVERLDEDLGNPQRHLRRLIENAILPLRRRASPLDRLESWLGSDASRKRLTSTLRSIAESDSEAARAAARALRDSTLTEPNDDVVRETLGALDLENKPGNPSYRKDAYARLHLWLSLFSGLEGCEGPVIILDEVENLYRAGVTRSERRTALRSLGFYCGGALPRACVVLAVTPDTLESLREEAGALLDEIEDQATLLPMEDVAMLRRRLLRARPIQVTRLGRADYAELAERAHKLARTVRGRQKDSEWSAFAAKIVGDSETPREILRRVVLREERLAWLASNARS
jgi:hypothetical protein